MPETLKDRSIHIRLEPQKPRRRVETVPEQGPDERLSLLFSRLVRWVADAGNAVARVKQEALSLNNDRAEDNTKPLLAIAAIMGGNWLRRAQTAFKRRMPMRKNRRWSWQTAADGHRTRLCTPGQFSSSVDG